MTSCVHCSGRHTCEKKPWWQLVSPRINVKKVTNELDFLQNEEVSSKAPPLYIGYHWSAIELLCTEQKECTQ